MDCLRDCRCCDNCGGGGNVQNNQTQQYQSYINSLGPTNIMNQDIDSWDEEPYSIKVETWDWPIDETPVEVAAPTKPFPWWILIAGAMIFMSGKDEK